MQELPHDEMARAKFLHDHLIKAPLVTPSIDHIKVWGSKCYTYIDPKTIPAGQRHDKLVNTGKVGVFVGYTSTTKQLRVYSRGSIDLRLRNCVAGPKGTPNVIPDRKPRGRPKKEPAFSFTKTSAVISVKDTLNTTSTAPSNIITEGSPSGSPIVPAFTIAESLSSADPKTLSLNSPITSAAGAHDILLAPMTKAAGPVSKVMKSLETKIIEPVENIPIKPLSQAKTSIGSSSPEESNINLTN
ncbi:hypothetical protein K3495_g12264 [Podosphaera aphanis]|nr:hypothetical protein K3495_g12264 [Podosphaera aphanis]